MKTGVLLRCRDEEEDPNDPGHMTLYWESVATEEKHYSGFYFKLKDLPKEYRHRSKWRDYLFDNTVSGYIKNDISGRRLAEELPERIIPAQWQIPKYQQEKIEMDTRPRQEGLYSFNPDDHHCYNCVLWAVDTINKFITEYNPLPRVRQGRVGLMTIALREYKP